MSQVNTSAPNSDMVMAVVRPMPSPPAVTNARLPSSEICMLGPFL